MIILLERHLGLKRARQRKVAGIVEHNQSNRVVPLRGSLLFFTSSPLHLFTSSRT